MWCREAVTAKQAWPLLHVEAARQSKTTVPSVVARTCSAQRLAAASNGWIAYCMHTTAAPASIMYSVLLCITRYHAQYAGGGARYSYLLHAVPCVVQMHSMPWRQKREPPLITNRGPGVPAVHRPNPFQSLAPLFNEAKKKGLEAVGSVFSALRTVALCDNRPSE